MTAVEWDRIDRGLRQRIRALNLFIDDVYHDQRIVNDGVIPLDTVSSSKGFREQCVGLDPPGGVWCHITGTDLVRDSDGTVYVLEDNLRCPSGVSYVLENRDVMKKTFPKVFEGLAVRPVVDYPNRLNKLLEDLAPAQLERPSVAVLTPGIYNSAYFEHAFLAQQMGVELVEGATWSWRIVAFTCGRHAASRESTSFTGVSTMTSSIRAVFVTIQCSAFPD